MKSVLWPCSSSGEFEIFSENLEKIFQILQDFLKFFNDFVKIIKKFYFEINLIKLIYWISFIALFL